MCYNLIFGLAKTNISSELDHGNRIILPQSRRQTFQDTQADLASIGPRSTIAVACSYAVGEDGKKNLNALYTARGFRLTHTQHTQTHAHIPNNLQVYSFLMFTLF